MSEAGLAASIEKMAAQGIEESGQRSFEYYYRKLEAGGSGIIPESTIEPLSDVPSLEGLEYSREQIAAALGKVAIVKLNGGLGTGMGLDGPKTALMVKDGLTFTDIIVRQVLALRADYGVELPLLFMNSFRTSEETLALLANYPDLEVDGLPLEFIQSAVPKLRADDLMPVEFPADPELEWCPPGHGDIYRALRSTGVLDALRERGIEYLFASNADNLGATCSGQIAAWLLENDVPYLSEQCVRTPADRKGGHLARRMSDGRLILRDNAMVADDDMDDYQDIEKHTLFHCNNLWINLEALSRLLDEGDGLMGLPMIVNHKTVDPTDKTSTPVIQLETAMGTAVEKFEGARAMVVPRTRFRPVKATSDLLVLRSDRFELDAASHIVELGDGPTPVAVLDDVYKLIDDFDARFPTGAPSLIDCTSLAVVGDVTFEEGVTCQGDVTVVAAQPTRVRDRVLSGRVGLG